MTYLTKEACPYTEGVCGSHAQCNQCHESFAILTLFHGWKPITEERAKEWAKNIMTGAIAMSKEERLAHIHARLRGIRFDNVEEVYEWCSDTE